MAAQIPGRASIRSEGSQTTMLVYLISDHEETSGEIRKILLREGLDCPAAHVLTLDLAARRLAAAKPDLLVVVLDPDPERALSTLADLPRGAARVLAVGPTTEPRLVIRALRGGVDDYVDRGDLEAELKHALDTIQARRENREEAGRLIAVLAPSGGSGSSTLAANVATVLAKEHGRSALIDLKLEAGDLSALLDLKPTHTLSDLCQSIARVDRTLFDKSLARHASGVHLLAPPARLSEVRHVTPEAVRQVLSLARSGFPYVVVDLDHSFRDEQAQVLRQADVVLLVLRLDFASLRNARRALEHLEALGVPRDRLRPVVNRFGQAREIPAAKAEEALDMKIFHYVPEDPKTVNRANNNGVPLVLESPSAKVAKSLAKLAASVNGRHKAH